MFRPARLMLFGAVFLVVAAIAGVAVLVWNRAHPLRAAEAAVARGDLRAALIELRGVVRDDPRNAVAPLLLAQVHTRLGDLAAAERDLVRARSLGVDRWQVLAQLAPLYVLQRRFRDVLTDVPAVGPTPAIQGRNLAFRSRAYAGLADMGRAQASLTQAMGLAPADPEVQVAAARLALAQTDAAAAERALDAALAAAPNHAEALQLKGQMLAARGDMAGARAVADRAVAASPGAAAPLLDRAGLLLAMGQAREARADVAAVLRVQPRNPTAIYLDGVVAVQENRFDEATERLTALGATSALFGRAAYFQAVAALARNLPATAVEAADRYMARNSNDPEGVRLLARARMANRQPEMAQAVLEAAVARGMDDAQTLDQLGTVLASIGNVAGAAEAFNRALAKAPDQQVIRVHLASLQVRQGDAAGAAAMLERSSQAGAAHSGVRSTLAVAQIASGQLEAAAATVAALRAADGETEQAGVLGGMLALARLDVEGAIAAFSGTLRAFPDSQVAALDLARALVAGGRRGEARATILAVLTRDPRSPAALTSYVQLCVSDGMLGEAARAVEAARARAPQDEALLAMQADLVLRQGNPRRSIELLLARPAEGRQLTGWFMLARAYEAAGQPREAEAAYAKAFEVTPTVDVALALAALRGTSGGAKAAAASLEASLAVLPGDFDLLSRRVALEAETAGVEAALKVAAALRGDAAQMPAAALLAGDLLMRGGHAADAARAFAAEWPGSPSPALAVRLGEARIVAGDAAGAMAVLAPLEDDPSAALLMSRIYIERRAWAEAVRALERALSGRPGDAALLNNLAVAYQQTKDKRARATAQRAYLLNPSADNADTLGWIALEEGATGPAVTVLREAHALRPDDPAIGYHLAAALEAAGDREGARALLGRVVGQPSGFEGRDQAEALLTRISARP